MWCCVCAEPIALDQFFAKSSPVCSNTCRLTLQRFNAHMARQWPDPRLPNLQSWTGYDHQWWRKKPTMKAMNDRLKRIGHGTRTHSPR
jgi:hypothetical protein